MSSSLLRIESFLLLIRWVLCQKKTITLFWAFCKRQHVIRNPLLKFVLNGHFHWLEKNKLRIMIEWTTTVGKKEKPLDISQSPSKCCQLPSPISKSHSQKMFISKSMKVCLETPGPKYHRIAQHFKNCLASTIEIDANTGSLFSWLNPDPQPSYFREGEQCGAYQLKISVAKSLKMSLFLSLDKKASRGLRLRKLSPGLFRSAQGSCDPEMLHCSEPPCLQLCSENICHAFFTQLSWWELMWFRWNMWRLKSCYVLI